MKTRTLCVLLALASVVVFAIPAFAEDYALERKTDPGSTWNRLKENIINDTGQKAGFFDFLLREYDQRLKEKDEIVSRWTNLGRTPTLEMEREYRAQLTGLDNEIRLMETTLRALKKNLECARQLREFMLKDGTTTINPTCQAEQ